MQPNDDEERDDAVIGVAMKWSLVVLVVLAGLAGLAWKIFQPVNAPPLVVKTDLKENVTRARTEQPLPKVPFTDITAEAGIDFVHENGAAGEKLLPETMGGGGAFFDYDSDGDADLLLVNSQRWTWDTRPATEPATLRLYRNEAGRFVDVTKEAGLDVSLYGMGVACGDFDNDGHVDLFLSAVGPNRLFRNDGQRHFVDVTDAAGITTSKALTAIDVENPATKERTTVEFLPWSTSCGWCDIDNDSDLDLLVLNYVKWSREFDLAQNFQLTGGGRAYGRPQTFGGTFPYLFRNDGGGRFSEVSEAAGLRVWNPASRDFVAKSLGLTFSDLDSDGFMDVLVANDTVQNFLFHNQKNGTFQEVGAASGIAFDTNGTARGAMGVDSARFRNSDAIGVAIGNFSNEMTALYVSNAPLQFADEAVSSGLGPATRLELKFGLCFLDVDLDGRLDLFEANGHLEDEIHRVLPSQTYEQSPHLFWNCGANEATEFRLLTEAECGASLFRKTVGRGASYADIDGDGDLDLLIMAAGKPPRLLRNDQQLGHHWLRLKLVGKKSNRDAIGATVRVTAGKVTQTQQVMPTRSYLSQVELPLTFGLGSASTIDRVTVRWPGGKEQELTGLAIDKLHRVEEAD